MNNKEVVQELEELLKTRRDLLISNDNFNTTPKAIKISKEYYEKQIKALEVAIETLKDLEWSEIL